MLEVVCISAYPYAYRTPTPISVSLSVSPHERLPSSKFYDRRGKFPRSEELEEKIKGQWGTVRYTDPVAFVREEKYVGIMREEGIAAAETGERLIDALMTEKGGIDELTVCANENGYRAILRAGNTIVNVEYNGETLTAHQYKKSRYDPGIVRSRVHSLRASEPKTNRDAATNDLGVVAYGAEKVVVRVASKRKRINVCSPEERRVTEATYAAEFVRKEFAYNLQASFATAEEVRRIENGENVQFTINFKGYRHPDEAQKERDDLLARAYLDGVSTGVKGILRKLERVYTGQQRQREDRDIITDQEWFSEIFMKAKATPRKFADMYGYPINDPIHEVRIDKDHPMYLVAAKRFLRRKPKIGEVIVLQETTVYPTIASLEARQAEYLKERAARRAGEATAQANQKIWNPEDARQAQRDARRFSCG